MGADRMSATFHRGSVATVKGRSAQHFQLDQCLSAKAMEKIIYSLTSVAETRQKTRTDNKAAAGGEQKTLGYDVDGFSTFLAGSKSLSVLLFWKEAEDYTTLFGMQERQAAAEKIFERYIRAGAEFEVTGVTDQTRKTIHESLSSPDEELFVELQKNAYDTMLFELFPAFWEAIKKQDRLAGVGDGAASRSKLTEKTTLMEVLKSNDLEIHLFAEYCREHMCEEAVTFLLEVNMYQLLFDPMDLETQAQRMYQLYIDDKSEGRIGGVSDKVKSDIQTVLDANNVLNTNAKELRKSTRRPSSDTGITPQLFDAAAREAMGTLEMDVWPRYKEAVLSGGQLKLDTGRGGGKEEEEDEGKRPTKAAVLAAMRNPTKLEHLRTAAGERGMREGVDFCVEVEAYKLLFAEADRKPRAEAMWNLYVAPGCDLPVNIPDTMNKQIEKNYKNAPANLFDQAENELLGVIASNIYDRYLATVEAAAGPPSTADQLPAKPPPSSGGCCLIM